ncbi:hypothetical protein WN944_029150 [Citrus x changshan-huyou]|uniref:Uncharacterized protein n=1 Tax=Citrus x changshan-huyou TaxID=2935761 RepID=A0AAP0LL48_9ROSI
MVKRSNGSYLSDFRGPKESGLRTTICDAETSKISATCQEIPLKQPSIPILDEGHTPRNENTDVLLSLAKVRTPRKDTFYELVGHNLQSDENFQRKVREMISEVLHYYKGDFLNELPGLVDFTVVLNLSSRQKSEIQKLKKWSRKIKIAAAGSATYLHPKLATCLHPKMNSLSEKIVPADDKMDELLDR